MRPVGAIILAAGASRRFGSPKQMLQFRGSSFLRRAVNAAVGGGCRPVVVVQGAVGSLEQELADTPAELVQNALWEGGMGTSIRAGLNHLLGPGDDLRGVVLLTCDQPLVEPQNVTDLLAIAKQAGLPIAASRYANTLGIPAYFDRSYFHELQNLADGAGAKSVIFAHPECVAEVAFEDGALDIDTPDDFHSLTHRAAASINDS